MDEQQKELKILCPFCNEVWDAKMIIAWDGTYYENVRVEIFCSKCRKLVCTKNF